MKTPESPDMPADPGSDETIFAAALQWETPAQRAAYLDEACAGNPALRARVEELLRASEAAPTFLERPVGVPRPPGGGPAPTVKVGFSELMPATEGPGTKIGRYKLLQQIGEGGCGTVFMAEQEEPVRRRVALKVIKLGMDTKSVVARFEAERQALAMMDHPNIAKVLDAGATDSGRPYFVMELVRGIPITRYCDENKLDTQQRLDLFIRVCHAIQHAHQKGIIHRDIKPSNILVTLHDGTPVPKVIDFGIAKATEGRLTNATLFTAFEQFIGTPAYMSPEQAEMSGLDIDTRSDIYALGVLLYELLTGKTPFDAKELVQSGLDAMRRTIREKEPQRPSTRLSTMLGDALTATAAAHGSDAVRLLKLIRGDLDWIVMKCLEKDRTRRYETANGLAADLKRHLNNEPVVARPPSAAYKFQKAYRRNRLAFTAAACVFVSLVIALAFIWVAGQREGLARVRESAQRNLAERRRVEAEAAQKVAETERQRATESEKLAKAIAKQARRNLYVADINLAQHSLQENNLGRAVRLLDRHRPKPGEEDLRGWEWRYLWQLTRGSDHVTLTNRPVRGWDVSLSPDGKYLAAGWIDGQVDLWDVAARRLIRTLSNGGDSGDARVAFSPVRNLLAATSGSEVVTFHNLDSGRVSQIWHAPDSGKWAVARLAFSQDGAKLAIYAESGSYDLTDEAWVMDVSTSRTEHRHSTQNRGVGGHTGGIQLSPDGTRLYLVCAGEPQRRYSIQCLDMVTDRELWQTEWLKDSVGLSTLVLSPDGRVLASGSGFQDPAIRVWDAETGRLLHTLDGHTAWVCKLEFSQDGRQLISAATDQTIRFWDTNTWKETRVLRGHRDEVHAVAISDTAQLVASASKDGDLNVWTLKDDNARRGRVRLPENLNLDQAKLLDRSRLLLLPAGRPPELLDLKADSAPVSLSQLGTSTTWVKTFGTTLLGAENDGDTIVVNELRGDEIVPLGRVTPNPGAQVTGGGYCAGRQLFVWTESTASNSVYLVDLKTPGRRIEIESDVSGMSHFTFSEDGKHLLGWTESIDSWRVWNVETGRIVAAINEKLQYAVFGDGGRVLVTVTNRGLDYEIAFYDLANPDAEPRRITGKFGSFWLAASPDGSLVTVSTRGGAVELYDPAKGKLIATLHGHMNSVGQVVFSPDGQRLISMGSDGQIKLWDRETRQELLNLHGGGAMRWTADGDVILSGAHQAWIAPTLEEITAAEAKNKVESEQP